MTTIYGDFMALLKKNTSLLLLCLISCITYGQAAETLTLQKALQLAIENNPSLAEMQARSDAMADIPLQLATLPDPVVSLNALNLPTDNFDLDQENMTQLQAGFSQLLPFPGKLELREEGGTHEAQAAAHSVIEARWLLLRDVEKAWWSLVYLDHALNIIATNQGLLQQFVDIAQSKYQVGQGLQQDVLLAQLEFSKLLDNTLSLEAARDGVRARLNRLIDRSANQLIKLPITPVDRLPVLKKEAELFAFADAHRALLAVKRESVKAARSRLALAKKDFYPDVNVGAFYSVRDDMPNGQDRADFLSLRLSMSVPIFTDTKQQKAVDQRNKEVLQKKFSLRDASNRVHSQISTAYSQYQKSRQQVQLFKTGIIPQARQTVASMLAGYQVDKVDFLNLVRSQIILYNYEIQYWKALTEAKQVLAQLMAVVGKEDIYE